MTNVPTPLPPSPDAAAPSKALPASWVERLFERLSAFYGAKFADLWRGCDLDAVKHAWAEALGDLTAPELKAGLDACLTRVFPPTLPEFRSLCRPALDYERAFLEAVEQMQKRESGKDVWSNPAFYWAATKIGNDISYYTYAHMKARWHAALDDALTKIADGRLPHTVPARMTALPAPGKVSSEVAQANIAKIHAMFENSRLKKRAA